MTECELMLELQEELQEATHYLNIWEAPDYFITESVAVDYDGRRVSSQMNVHDSYDDAVKFAKYDLCMSNPELMTGEDYD